jgi:hypothetical protein
MSSSRKQRQRRTGVANSRVNIGRDRKGKAQGSQTYQFDSLDDLSLETQRRSTAYSRARGNL